MIHFINNYFEKINNYSAGRFIIEMYIILFILKFIVLNFSIEILISFNIVTPEDFIQREEFLKQFHWIIGFLIACIFAPIIETIIFQALPILLGSIVTSNKVIIVIISSILFTTAHSSSPPIVLLYLFLAGIIYAVTYIIYRDKGCISAIFITSIIHSLSNLVPFILTYFF